jgi:hypothetical protein
LWSSQPDTAGHPLADADLAEAAEPPIVEHVGVELNRLTGCYAEDVGHELVIRMAGAAVPERVIEHPLVHVFRRSFLRMRSERSPEHNARHDADEHCKAEWCDCSRHQ